MHPERIESSRYDPECKARCQTLPCGTRMGTLLVCTNQKTRHLGSIGIESQMNMLVAIAVDQFQFHCATPGDQHDGIHEAPQVSRIVEPLEIKRSAYQMQTGG